MNPEAEQVLDELIELFQHFDNHTKLSTKHAWQTLLALKELKRLVLKLDHKYTEAKEVS